MRIPGLLVTLALAIAHFSTNLGHGRVEAILHSAFVRVRWIDNGWISDLAFNDVEVI
jgi:hypothetical protein